VLPHFDTFGHRWIESARRELPEVTLLGIDERTAAVWKEDRWVAAGPGAVTVISAMDRRSFRSGSQIEGLPDPLRILPQK
jgi:cyanophycinase-like exopeptidase